LLFAASVGEIELTAAKRTGMSADTKHALRHVLCLTNRSGLQAAPWGDRGIKLKRKPQSGELLTKHRKKQLPQVCAASCALSAPTS
jgi:hypothetical protein